MSDSIIKAGIIGLGVGRQHIVGYEAHPQCKVVKVCDLDVSKKKELIGAEANIDFTTDPFSILKDPEIDVVSIASYDNFHYEQIMEALRHDKHIFVEKPLCIYRKEADEIWSLLQQKQSLKLSSNLILRKCPRFINLKERIQSGDMGELYYLQGAYNYGRIQKLLNSWRGEIDFYSIIYGGGVHLLDLFQWLTNWKVDRVSAFGNSISTKDSQFNYNDLVAGILEFSNGATGQLTANFGCVAPHFHELSVYGTEQTFKNGWPYANLHTSRNPEVEPEILKDEYPGAQKGDHLYKFIESILEDCTEPVPAKDVFDIMSVCFALEEAVEKQKVMKVNYYE